jgi:hypothetical protein
VTVVVLRQIQRKKKSKRLRVVGVGEENHLLRRSQLLFYHLLQKQMLIKSLRLQPAKRSSIDLMEVIIILYL